MMMMSAPSSSFHDYLAMDSCFPKMEAMTPIQISEDQYTHTFDDNKTNSNVDTTITSASHSNSNSNNRNSRNSVVKRPMNAFLLWARGERKRVSSDGYGVSQTSLSKLLGETWRHMSVEEKQPFLDMAETLKRQHHMDHPDYKFKPKQRSTNGNQTNIKKNHSFAPQKYLSNKVPLSRQRTSSNSYSYQPSLPPISHITPHPVQANVLAMCQSIISTVSSENDNNSWFGQMIGQPQTVIVTPISRTQTSPLPSRRAVRIQIINKHDDIALPPPNLLPMTPPPPASSSSSSSSSSVSFFINESVPTLADYFADHNSSFNIPISNNHQILASHANDPNDYETIHDSSLNHLTDLDQPYDSSGWIDTPLSSFGTNSTDMVPSSPYMSYDFLCL